MSLINQMLQDLEKRRASGAERGVLPRNVRTLPPVEKSNIPWFAAGGCALVVIAAVAWYAVSPRLTAPVAQRQPAAVADALVQSSLPSGPQGLAPQPAAIALTPGNTAPAAGSGSGKVAVAGPIATSSIIAPEPSDSRKSGAPASVAPEDSRPRKEQPAAAEAVEPARAAPPAARIAAAGGAKGARPENRAEERLALAAASVQIDKRTQQLTPQQLAENDYRDGANLLNQGRLPEAAAKFKLALEHHPAHIGARQGLFGLLIEAKKTGEAEQLLQEGLQLNPHQAGFAMALARMQVERGDIPGAIDVLQKTAPAGVSSPDYLAFLGALLQRQSRHAEAVDHYRAALSLAPASGVWHMGLGISLQALNRNAEAQDAFRRAKASNALNGELRAFVDDRLTQLQQR